MMYYLINYVPTILCVIISIASIKIDFGVFAILYLFAQPLYLLIVNTLYICNKTISWFNSIIHMFSTVLLNVIYVIIIHKIKTGYYIGDVPEGIYYLMIGIPCVIILIGTCIMYFVKK